MSYQFIFGPVPSRRLGLSLGVDLVPQKTCSLDCVYCECGRTTDLTLSPHEYVPVAGVIQEIDDYMSLHSKPDVLTFSGFGEPTLHSGIDTIVAHVKSRYPDLPVVLLTNSTLLHKKEVRDRLMQIDRIIASVDAVTEAVFRRVNRPHGQLTCEMVLNGIRDLKKEYSKELWLEIFIIPDINNVNSEINVIKRFINEIQPDKIQLNTLDRPGTEDWVQPATPARY